MIRPANKWDGRGIQRGLRRALVIVGWCGLGWLMLLGGLGSFGFLGPDEPRYAAIARGMLHRGDWITPQLWGAPWFEKPVLYYWLAAISDAISHASTAASRLPNAVLTLVLVALMSVFLHRTHSARAGVLAGFLGLTTLFLFSFGRAATTDMTLAVPFALGMMALYLASFHRAPAATPEPTATGESSAANAAASPRVRIAPAWLSAAAALLALATLAKGPVAVVLAVLTWIGFAATQGRFRLFWRLITPRSISLYVLVTAPWFVLVELQHPAFFKLFFWRQNLERFATNRFEHPQPVWFYVPVLLLALFPWTGWLGLPLAAFGRRLRRRGWRRAWDGRDAALTFYLGCWTLAPVFFFSLSHSKLPGYILPSIPAAILLIAVLAAEEWEHIARWPLAISAVLAALIPGVILLAPWFLLPRDLRRPWVQIAREPVLIALVATTLLVLLVLLLRRRTGALVAATVILTAGAVLAMTRPPLSAEMNLRLSGQPLARQLIAGCNGGLPEHCGSTPLYAWHLRRDLQYGAEFYLQAPISAWPESAASAPSAPAHALVVMDRAALPAFATQFGAHRHLLLLPRFSPRGGLAPWLVIEVTPFPAMPGMPMMQAMPDVGAMTAKPR